MTLTPARKTAALLFVSLATLYMSLSPGSIVARGYVEEEVASGTQMLAAFNAWVKGRPVPPMVWSRHGPIPVLFDLPFIKLGKRIATPDFVMSLQASLLTAALLTVVFLWLRKLCSPGSALFLTLTGAFGTMLWPYAYIGLETKQSFFVLLAGYLGLACGRQRGWPRMLLFALVCSMALSVKSVGIVVWPAIAYVIYAQFRGDWHKRIAPLAGIVSVIGVIWFAGNTATNYYWDPLGGSARSLGAWMITSPMQLLTNAIGLFGSPAKGLFVFAPILLVSLWALPRAFRANRDVAVFAVLVTACTVGFLSLLIHPSDETWGPRFMHIVIAPLLLCIGAAWPRLQWRSHAPMLVLALAGFAVSFAGSFFYYGARGWAIGQLQQNTMEWLTGDSVWNEVAFNARLFPIWFRNPLEPVEWTPTHIWVWGPPPGLPPPKTLDMRDFAKPQSVVFFFWDVPLEGLLRKYFLFLLGCSAVGFISLAGVVFRTAEESGASDRKKSLLLVPFVFMGVTALTWIGVAKAMPPPAIQVSKEEVAPGMGYYLRIRDMPNSMVEIRYSIDGGEAQTFTADLDLRGDVRFDVGNDSRKGMYRFSGYRTVGAPSWTDAQAVISVR